MSLDLNVSANLEQSVRRTLCAHEEQGHVHSFSGVCPGAFFYTFAIHVTLPSGASLAPVGSDPSRVWRAKGDATQNPLQTLPENWGWCLFRAVFSRNAKTKVEQKTCLVRNLIRSQHFRIRS